MMNIDEEQTNHIRETRMALMLEKALIEEEERMVCLTAEATETRLHLSEVIIRQLLQ